MSYGLPPIVKRAEGLMGEIERAVAHFPRRYRYTVGARLSEEALQVALLAHEAWLARERLESLTELARAIDRLKLRMQLAQHVQAFASFAQFESLARVAADLGRQCYNLAHHESPRQYQTRRSWHADICALEVDDAALLRSQGDQLRALRRCWNHGLRALARLPLVSHRHGRVSGPCAHGGSAE